MRMQRPCEWGRQGDAAQELGIARDRQAPHTRERERVVPTSIMKAAQQEESPMMANAGGEETKTPWRWDKDEGGT